MYYRLDWKVSPPDPALANTTTGPDLKVPWTMGCLFERPLPEPITCPLNPRAGRKMRDLFLIDVPLFSDRLVEALHAVPVDNLKTYRAEVRAPEGQVFANYKAINIIGSVACADLTRSEYEPGTEAPSIEFSHLVIDERKVRDFDLFRLAENTLFILVSERVKRRLEPLGLVGASLVPIEG